MTVKAARLDGSVLEFDLPFIFRHGFMTLKTEFIARLQEVELIFCRMGVMALDTISLSRDLMGAHRFLRQNPLMAFEADPVRIRSQQLSV